MRYGLGDPPTYLDPSLLAAKYPPITRPTLPNTFVAPDLERRSNTPAAGVGGGLVVLAGLGVLAWAVSRPNRP